MFTGCQDIVHRCEAQLVYLLPNLFCPPLRSLLSSCQLLHGCGNTRLWMYFCPCTWGWKSQAIILMDSPSLEKTLYCNPAYTKSYIHVLNSDDLSTCTHSLYLRYVVLFKKIFNVTTRILSLMIVLISILLNKTWPSKLVLFLWSI